jgi:uncharacterized protein (DUF1697 family)
MPVIVSMLRGVNLGPHHRVRMDALRALYESLRFTDVQTYLQSGNVIFRTKPRDLAAIASQIEDSVERKFGFHADVLVRTTAEMRRVVEKNPFSGQRDLDPSKFLVTFLALEPTPEARQKVLEIKTDPDELRLEDREIYIYYPNGLARPKITWSQFAARLKTSGTGRNWTTVQALLEMAEKLEDSSR